MSDPDGYVIVTANTDYAMPGDTIEVIHQQYSTGKQFVVIERPDDKNHYPKGCAWHENPNGSPSFCRKEYYKIVKRKNEGVSTPSIDLDKSLKQKRDKLLRGWFT